MVAIKVITKKNLSKTQNLLSKEIRILKVSSAAYPAKVRPSLGTCCLYDMQM